MRKKTTTKVTMIKRKILTIIWTALVIAALSACGSSYTSESSKASEDENTKSDAEKEETAIYETPRLSLNTCQVCNPSPRAYFKEQNGKLVCQNCGNVFTIDSVGETTGGCNPMYIDYKNTDGKLTVTVADLDTYTDQFASWDGPVK